MDWMKVALVLIGAIAGYILAVSRDRVSAIRSRKFEAITKLHEHVLETEKSELSDGKSMALAVAVEGGTKN